MNALHWGLWGNSSSDYWNVSESLSIEGSSYRRSFATASPDELEDVSDQSNGTFMTEALAFCHDQGQRRTLNGTWLPSVLEQPVQMATSSRCLPLMNLAHAKAGKVLAGMVHPVGCSGQGWGRAGES